MAQVSKRLPVLLALLIGMAMAFAVWGMTPNAVFANDDDEVFELDQIEIQNDGSLEWGPKVILLNNAEDTVSWDDLSVVVKDQGGNPVADSDYDLQLQAVWYSDAEHKDHLEDVTNQESFGLMGDEVSSGCTEYRLTATPAENSSYVGEASLSFYLVDRTSLSYICSEISFKDPAKVTGWRMRDWYWFWAGDPIVSEVRAECGFAEAPLTEGEDYTVTYYTLQEDVDIYSDRPEEDFLGDMVEDEYGNPAVPTEPGDYFAVIEGKGDYHGGDMFPVSIMGSDQIMFVPENDMDLWSNGVKKYTLTKAGGVAGDSVALKVGFRDGDDWVKEFRIGEDYTYDPATGLLTLKGEKIVTEETKDNWLCMFAQIGEGDSALTGEEYVQLRLVEHQIDEPEDVELLPGWERTIDSIHCFIRDQQHFDGEEFNQPIKNARIKSQDSEDGEVLELWREENGEWKYRAMNPGRAVIEIEFDDPLGGPVSCEFIVTVSDMVYHVDLWAEEGVYQGLPGDSITLNASARKEWKEDNGEPNPEDWEQHETSDGLTYKWELESDEFATVTPNGDTAVLTFKDMPNGWDSIGEPVKVSVSVCDEDSDDPDEVRAKVDKEFWVQDQFYQIYPTQIDSDLDIGGSFTLEPEVRYYSLDQGQGKYSVVEDVDYEITQFDDNAIEVDGLTITRRGGWDTDFCLKARWDDGGETEQWYHLNNKDYRIEFGFDDVDVYDDSFITLDPWIENLDSAEGADFEIRYSVGRWDGEDWEDCDEDVYELDGMQLRIFGDELEKTGWGGLNVHAELFINDEYYSDQWCWVNLRDSCIARGYDDHNWLKGILKQPTLDEVGYEVWICPDYMFLGGCGETRLREIPKLIDINDAEVTVAEQAYTGKALKPALTVTYGGKTLKAGVDYTATYSNNTNVGTATVTLKGISTAVVTPEGEDYPALFGGTKNAAFKIVKGVNPMVVKTKAVTLKAKKVQKKKQTIKAKKAFTVTGNQGKVTYKKKSGNGKITIASNGTITVKKGLKKGKYKFVVNVTAAGNGNYNTITKAATVKITVK